MNTTLGSCKVVESRNCDPQEVADAIDALLSKARVQSMLTDGHSLFRSPLIPQG